jgi:hypothetical protein
MDKVCIRDVWKYRKANMDKVKPLFSYFSSEPTASNKKISSIYSGCPAYGER